MLGAILIFTPFTIFAFWVFWGVSSTFNLFIRKRILRQKIVLIYRPHDNERWYSYVWNDEFKPGQLFGWRYPNNKIGLVSLDPATMTGTAIWPVQWRPA